MKNEVGELRMVVIARDDEIYALKTKITRYSEMLGGTESSLGELQPAYERQGSLLEELQRQLEDAKKAHQVAETGVCDSPNSCTLTIY